MTDNAANDSNQKARCPICDSVEFVTVQPIPHATWDGKLTRTDKLVPTDPSQGVLCGCCGTKWHITSLVGVGYAHQKRAMDPDEVAAIRKRVARVPA